MEAWKALNVSQQENEIDSAINKSEKEAISNHKHWKSQENDSVRHEQWKYDGNILSTNIAELENVILKVQTILQECTV